MTIEKISIYEKHGFNRWQKGDYDRLYLNAKYLGLECRYHKTGTIAEAWLNGEAISNRFAGKLKYAKMFVDVKSDSVHCDCDYLSDLFRDYVEKVEAEAGNDVEE